MAKRTAPPIPRVDLCWGSGDGRCLLVDFSRIDPRAKRPPTGAVAKANNGSWLTAGMGGLRAHKGRNDGVDGTPNRISVPSWSLSKPHLKAAVRGQVYSRIELGHPPWARSGEEGLSGSRRRCERRDRGGAQARTRLFLLASAVCGGDGSVLIGTSLGAAIAGARPRSEADPARACEARSLPSGLTRGSGATRTIRSMRRRFARQQGDRASGRRRSTRCAGIPGFNPGIGVIAPQGV